METLLRGHRLGVEAIRAQQAQQAQQVRTAKTAKTAKTESTESAQSLHFSPSVLSLVTMRRLTSVARIPTGTLLWFLSVVKRVTTATWDLRDPQELATVLASVATQTLHPIVRVATTGMALSVSQRTQIAEKVTTGMEANAYPTTHRQRKTQCNLWPKKLNRMVN
jgi:hypothetical protein